MAFLNKKYQTSKHRRSILAQTVICKESLNFDGKQFCFSSLFVWALFGGRMTNVLMVILIPKGASYTQNVFYKKSLNFYGDQLCFLSLFCSVLFNGQRSQSLFNGNFYFKGVSSTQNVFYRYNLIFIGKNFALHHFFVPAFISCQKLTSVFFKYITLTHNNNSQGTSGPLIFIAEDHQPSTEARRRSAPIIVVFLNCMFNTSGSLKDSTS